MIHFTCISCKYEISAADDEVGQFVVCPSCFTNQRIPPPKTNEKIKAAEKSEHIYETHKSGTFNVFADDVPVRCRICHTLVYAHKSEIGTEIECPDCGTKNSVQLPSVAGKCM